MNLLNYCAKKRGELPNEEKTAEAIKNEELKNEISTDFPTCECKPLS